MGNTLPPRSLICGCLLVCFCSNKHQINTKIKEKGRKGKIRTRTNLVFMRVYVELVSGLEPLTC